MAAPALDGITVPREGLATLRAVLNQHWRVVVQDFMTLPVRRLDPAHMARHTRVFEIVQGLVKRDPRKVVRALRHPTVAGITAAARRQTDPAAVNRFVEELDLLLLAELAAQGDLSEEVAVENVAPTVLRSLAWHQASPAGDRVVFRAGAVEPWTPLEAAYTEIAHGIYFATSDNNPLLSVQGHPDRPGNTIDLGGHPVDEWLASLRAAFAVIEQYAPLIMEEMKLLLELIVPVGYHDERHFSVSYEDSVGAIYLTLHPNVMTMAEALIHEFQHNKLNAVFRWEPILRNAHAPLYASPVRPDPRPLHGVLLAVHAFQPVAKLYEAMTAAGDPLALGRDWQKRFKQIVEINREGAETVLKHGQPTPLGVGLLNEMYEWDKYFAAYAREHWAETPAV